MTKRLRTPVLYVHHRSELGGAPASLSYLIRELDDEQFEPHIYCPPGPAAELFREAGARVHTGPVAGFTHIWASTYRGRRWLLFARELALLPQHVLRFRRTLRRNQFELVHFNDSPLIPAAWLARREHLPVVWHLRSALPDGGKDARSAFVRAAIQKLATTSIAITHDVANVFGVGSTVVPNSVDLERFHPGDPAAAKAALGLPADRPVVSYFGFIYPSKGFREFIEAAARLRDRGLDASYLIVGGAVRGEEFFRTLVGRSLQLADLTRNYESEAKQLVDELGLTELFRFVPFTQDTANLYQASDVVVAPSQGPELGRPVIEAAASGARPGFSSTTSASTPSRRQSRSCSPSPTGASATAAPRGRTRRRTSTLRRTPGGSSRSTGGSHRSASASPCSTCTIGRSSAVRRPRSRSSSVTSTTASSRTSSARKAPP